MKITKQRLRQVIKEELVNMSDLLAPGLGEDVRFTTVESRDDAMRGADRPGAGIEDLADTEEEETRDRAFVSPKERLFILMNAREALSKMTSDELAELSLSLDAPMVATLRHILANPMYKEGDEMELEEYGGAYSKDRYAPRADGSEPGERSANLASRSSSSEAAQSKKRMQNYRGGSNISPYGSSR
jgi:hypothetical protein